MNNKTVRIDLAKLGNYLLKRCWLLIICAVIGAGYSYRQTVAHPDTYTSWGTMYVYNANPNLINYGYVNSSDLTSAVMLVDTYTVVVKSNRVLDAVVERLTDYPGITSGYIASTISMSSVANTGVVRVICRTDNPQKSADICNAVLTVAPNEIKRVVGAGDVVIMDYALVPTGRDARNSIQHAMTGGLIGGGIALAVLLLLFFLNQQVDKPEELTQNYTPPVLSSIQRYKSESDDPSTFLLSNKNSMEQIESYAKLRINLFYTLVDKPRPIVMVTSPISGEGKSTIAANLAISVAMSKKRVLLIDADMRRGCQRELFRYSKELPGLSNVLVGSVSWKDALLATSQETMQILPSGTVPPNPAELLESPAMHQLLAEVVRHYDLVLLDVPPINIVADPLALSNQVAGAIFVVRQSFSDHREIKKALRSAELTGLNLLGFVFYGDNFKQGSYYYRRYYRAQRNYYHTYDPRPEDEDPDDGVTEVLSDAEVVLPPAPASRRRRSADARETAKAKESKGTKGKKKATKIIVVEEEDDDEDEEPEEAFEDEDEILEEPEQVEEAEEKATEVKAKAKDTKATNESKANDDQES